MKKIAISLLALAAVSTAAFAGEFRGYDQHDSRAYTGKHSNQAKNRSTSVNAFAAVNESTGALTAFERMQRNAEENESGHH
jgi:hypothetical protein